MELSQNIEDEQGLKRQLDSMGVEGIPGLQGQGHDQPADD
jgi:DNA-directed RNA polymerase subunit B"